MLRSAAIAPEGHRPDVHDGRTFRGRRADVGWPSTAGARPWLSARCSATTSLDSGTATATHPGSSRAREQHASRTSATSAHRHERLRDRGFRARTLLQAVLGQQGDRASSGVGGERHAGVGVAAVRSEEHTSELQSRQYLVCRLLLEKKKQKNKTHINVVENKYNYCTYIE